MSNEVATPTTPAPAAEKPAETATPATPTPAPTAELTPEQKALMESIQKAAQQTQAAAAKAANSDPWYWNDFSKGVYTGAGVVLLALAGYTLYKKYAGQESAE